MIIEQYLLQSLWWQGSDLLHSSVLGRVNRKTGKTEGPRRCQSCRQPYSPPQPSPQQPTRSSPSVRSYPSLFHAGPRARYREAACIPSPQQSQRIPTKHKGMLRRRFSTYEERSKPAGRSISKGDLTCSTDDCFHTLMLDSYKGLLAPSNPHLAATSLQCLLLRPHYLLISASSLRVCLSSPARLSQNSLCISLVSMHMIAFGAQPGMHRIISP